MYVCCVADKISNMTRQQSINASDQAGERSPQNAMTKSHVWPNATVPYVIDHSLSKLSKRINWSMPQDFCEHSSACYNPIFISFVSDCVKNYALLQDLC